MIPKGAKPLGEWGETRMADYLGWAGSKPSKPFRSKYGLRYTDRLVNGIAHESKAGINVQLTEEIATQIAKDLDLIDQGLIKNAHWHFWQGADKHLLNPWTKLEFRIRCIDMRFEQFEQLNETEARRLLDSFRNSELSRAQDLLLQSDVLEGAFTVGSLLPFLEWVSRKLQTTKVPADENVPDWIRETPDYRNSLFEFDESSRSLIVSAAFYLGETFVRSFARLDWGLGDEETALCNMPVVRGFSDGEELPPLLVLENVFSRMISSPERTGDIQRMVTRWASQVD